jgi:O-antigen/teichoic acid export membrane protein
MARLRSRATTAAVWIAVGSAGRTLLQVGQLAILTRLLEPEAFGLMAVVLAVISVGSLFADGGLSSAFLQRRAVPDECRSSLYWVNLLLATAVALIIAVFSPLIAWAYDDSTLTWVILMCCPIFVLSAAGRQFEVASEKSLKFRSLVSIELCSAAIGVAAAIGSALAGWGVYSLPSAALAASLTKSVLAMALLSDGWQPQARLRFADVRSYIGFGSATLASNLINQVNLTIDIFLGGRLLGVDALGVYSVPRTMVMQTQGIINPIVTRVGFPVIAEVQGDPRVIRRAYELMVGAVAALGAPIYAAIAVLAADICSIFLGPRWNDAPETLSVLAIWAAVRSIGNPVGALLLGLGHAKRALAWNSTLLGIYPIALVIGSKFGVIGLASSLLATALILLIPGWRWLVQPFTGWELRGYLATTMLPLLIAVGSCLAAKTLTQQMANVPLRIGITLLVAGMGYGVVMAALSPSARHLARLIVARDRRT